MIVLNKKTETDEKIEITLRLYIDEVSLVLNKIDCIRCDICKTVCPKEAISVIRDQRGVRIDIDEEKCVLCEICSHFCPVSAITLTYNQLPKTVLLDHQGILPLAKKIIIDSSRCPSHCSNNPEGQHRWCKREEKIIDNTVEDCPKFCFSCIQNCPRDIIEMKENSARPDERRCLACHRCFDSCEFGSITITPLFCGEISIISSLCPEDCNKCIEQCPTEAIHREGRDVIVNERYCSFCGACFNICDKDAIKLKRKEIKAGDGEFSVAWSKAVEKLLG